MNKLFRLCVFALSVLFANTVNAVEEDVEKLNQRVELKVTQIAETGLLPTATEIEVITGDIVDEEIKATELTVEQAIEKYELTPTLERYIRIKKAQADLAAKSNGGGREPPNL